MVANTAWPTTTVNLQFRPCHFDSPRDHRTIHFAAHVVRACSGAYEEKTRPAINNMLYPFKSVSCATKDEVDASGHDDLGDISAFGELL